MYKYYQDHYELRENVAINSLYERDMTEYSSVILSDLLNFGLALSSAIIGQSPGNGAGSSEPPVSSPMLMSEIRGAWTLRFGMFGWSELDMRGGVITIGEDGGLFGGDSNFVYRGCLAISGSGLNGTMRIDRHGADPEFKNSFGTNESHYDLALTLEPISSDRLEGYLQRPFYPDIHLSMARLNEDKRTRSM